LLGVSAAMPFPYRFSGEAIREALKATAELSALVTMKVLQNRER